MVTVMHQLQQRPALTGLHFSVPHFSRTCFSVDIEITCELTDLVCDFFIICTSYSYLFKDLVTIVIEFYFFRFVSIFIQF